MNNFSDKVTFGVVSPLFYGSTAWQRLRSFQEIFPNLSFFNSDKFYPNYRRSLASVDRRLKNGPISRLFSYLILKWAINNRINVIWFDKELYISPSILAKLRINNIFTIFYSHDDQFNANNQSKNFPEIIKLFDLIVTTKTYNVLEYKKFYNLDNVIFINNAADPNIFYKLNNIEKKNLVSFVGFWELNRFNSVKRIGREININIYSNDKRWNAHNISLNNSVWDENYNYVLNDTLINLCFLRKENRDKQTSRSIEIPMSGNVMLAERTDEHLELFKEDFEALFFESDDELVDKVIYYQKNHDIIDKIGQRAALACLYKGYDWTSTFITLFKCSKFHETYRNF
jgi:hypothetical protein